MTWWHSILAFVHFVSNDDIREDGNLDTPRARYCSDAGIQCTPFADVAGN